MAHLVTLAEDRPACDGVHQQDMERLDILAKGLGGNAQRRA